MNIETIKSYGFTNNSSLPLLFMFDSPEILKRMYHIVVYNETEFYFRGMGSTIAKIENEEHLKQLIEEYELRSN